MSKQELEENRDNIFFGLALLAQMAPAMSSEELLGPRSTHRPSS